MYNSTILVNAISYNDLIELLNIYTKIFEEEDCDYPDRRKIIPREKAIQRKIDKLHFTSYYKCILIDIIYRSVGLSTDYIIDYLERNAIKVFGRVK